MKLVITRVSSASVMIDEKLYSEIGKGLLVLVGITGDDTVEDVKYLAKKCANMRIFADDEGKLNLSVLSISGEVMVVSNFTLYADASHGNRPSFTDAARPEIAEPLYESFCEELSGYGLTVKTGVFGADMALSSVNDGPVTIVIESRK